MGHQPEQSKLDIINSSELIGQFSFYFILMIHIIECF